VGFTCPKPLLHQEKDEKFRLFWTAMDPVLLMIVNPIRSFFGVSTLKKAGRAVKAGNEVNSKK
jgi:hypothetical protein